MILNIFHKPQRRAPMVEVPSISVSSDGIDGSVPSAPIRHVLIVPSSTLEEFSLKPGDLRENLVIDDSAIGALHSFRSGTVLEVNGVLIRLTVHCEPCGRIGHLVNTKAITHKRGYLGTFLTPGAIHIGDSIRTRGVQYEPVPYDLKERISWYLNKQVLPVEVTTLVRDIGLSLSYCRAMPRLIRASGWADDAVIFQKRREQLPLF
jgi:MOSC domain-containing protein YiiM